MKIAVVGGGVAGFLTAIEALARDWNVTLFHDPNAPRCSSTAAGMLAPYAELESANDTIFRIGMRSLEIWPSLLARLPRPVYFRREGSLLVAHKSDLPLLRHVIALIERRSGRHLQTLTPDEVQQIEPDVSQLHGVHLPDEAHIDTQGFIETASAYLAKACDVRATHVDDVAALRRGFDWVFDCRGIGAKKDVQELRGVRGEILWVHAPEITIRRAIRFVHPRYHAYIVPRPDNVYLVGASSIEAEDLSPLSVRTALELLSALYGIQPEFAEARIVKTDVNLRPAFPDNLPRVEHHDGLTRINGLFRHGYLLAPSVVRDAITHVASEANAYAGHRSADQRRAEARFAIEHDRRSPARS